MAPSERARAALSAFGWAHAPILLGMGYAIAATTLTGGTVTNFTANNFMRFTPGSVENGTNTPGARRVLPLGGTSRSPRALPRPATKATHASRVALGWHGSAKPPCVKARIRFSVAALWW